MGMVGDLWFQAITGALTYTMTLGLLILLFIRSERLLELKILVSELKMVGSLFSKILAVELKIANILNKLQASIYRSK